MEVLNLPQLRVEYCIEVEKIRPLGERHFAAKAIFSKQARIREWPVPLPEKEYWGRTEEEAKHKVRKAVEKWAAQCDVIVTEL